MQYPVEHLLESGGGMVSAQICILQQETQFLPLGINKLISAVSNFTEEEINNFTHCCIYESNRIRLNL